VTTFSSAPLWYATRATGIVAFLLLTASLVLGVVATQRRLVTRSWPGFATQDLHRNLSLLAVFMLLAHIVTTLVDTYVRVGWWALVLPGSSPYARLGVALGTTAFDLLLVVVVTSLVRVHLTARLWRVVHLSSYGVWPLVLLHFLMTGTDAAHHRWGFWLGLGCVVPVAAAAALRVRTVDQPVGPVRSLVGSAR
jgi:predicted ferric reductase